MPNKIPDTENNRANEGNQTSRHHHAKGAGSSFPNEEQIEQEQQKKTQEYYPNFDQTGRGVDPDARVKRED